MHAKFELIPIVRKGILHNIDEEIEYVRYWQSKSAQERIAAVTFMISQSLKKGQRMDKTIVSKRRISKENKNRD